MTEIPGDDASTRRRDRLLALYTALLVAAVLVWLSPGRIDMIDGQLRYDVAKNLLLHGEPVIREPALPGMIPGGKRAAAYGLGASVSGLPLVWLGFLLNSELVAQFLFSFTSPLFGALLAGLLVLLYRKLGVSARASVAWACVSIFATQVFPTALTVFDQVQEAALLAGAALLLLSENRSARPLAGLLAGSIVVWQHAYVVLIPPIAATMIPMDRLRDRKAWLEALPFWLGLALGPLIALTFNQYRFGDMTRITPTPGTPRLSNPLVGLAILLVSPGKGVLLYSPAFLLGLLGLGSLRHSHPRLFRFVVLVTVSQLLFVSSLLFCGGDWCWGPRYLAVTLPLLMLGAPFAAAKLRRSATFFLITISFCIQLLGISIDHHRFFFERDLEPHFWTDQSIYFRTSALFARPMEIAASLHAKLPKAAPKIFPGPYAGVPTFATYGPPPAVRAAKLGSQWERQFPGLFWPRPWPFWMRLCGLFEAAPVFPWIERLLVVLGLTASALLWRNLRTPRVRDPLPRAPGEAPGQT